LVVRIVFTLILKNDKTCCTVKKPKGIFFLITYYYTLNILKTLSACINICINIDHIVLFLDGTNIDIIGGPVYDKERKLTVGNTYTLDVGYEGPLQNDLAGLYYSSYDEVDSTTNTVTKRYILYIIHTHMLFSMYLLNSCLSV